jgi:hypothetical protein
VSDRVADRDRDVADGVERVREAHAQRRDARAARAQKAPVRGVEDELLATCSRERLEQIEVHGIFSN